MFASHTPSHAAARYSTSVVVGGATPHGAKVLVGCNVSSSRVFRVVLQPSLSRLRDLNAVASMA